MKKDDPYFTGPPEQYRIAPEPNPYADLKAAQARGEVIQCNTGTREDPNWCNFAHPLFALPPDFYRIKPAPKRVLMTSEDLPPVVWIRSQNGAVELMTNIRTDGRWETRNWVGRPDVFHEERYLWSPSQSGPWNSFMKEVEG